MWNVVRNMRSRRRFTAPPPVADTNPQRERRRSRDDSEPSAIRSDRPRLLMSRVLSCEAAPANSLGRQPKVGHERNGFEPRSGVRLECANLCRRFAAQIVAAGLFPWATAQGYLLPSLRDSRKAQRPRLRCGLVSRAHAACSPRRSGFTLVELISTCVLLGVVFSVSIPLLVTVARERLSAEQRQFALQHATNLLERAVVKDWSELPPGEQTLTAAPPDVLAMLPGLERQLTVTELSDEPRSKQVAVSIRWQGRAGHPVAPLALSAWVYPVQEGQP